MYGRSERSLFDTLLANAIRPDGRRCDAVRAVSVERDVVHTAYGSARVMWGPGIEVMAATRVELPPSEAPEEASEALKKGSELREEKFKASSEASGPKRVPPVPYRVHIDLAPSVALAWAGGERDTHDALIAYWKQFLQRILAHLEPIPASSFDDKIGSWQIFTDIVVLQCPVRENPVPACALALSEALRSTSVPATSDPDGRSLTTDRKEAAKSSKPHSKSHAQHAIIDIDSRWENACSIENNISLAGTIMIGFYNAPFYHAPKGDSNTQKDFYAPKDVSNAHKGELNGSSDNGFSRVKNLFFADPTAEELAVCDAAFLFTFKYKDPEGPRSASNLAVAAVETLPPQKTARSAGVPLAAFSEASEYARKLVLSLPNLG